MGSTVAFAKLSVERYPKQPPPPPSGSRASPPCSSSSMTPNTPIMACAPGYETKGAVLDHFGAGGDWRWGAKCSSWTWQDIVVFVCFLSIVRYQCARLLHIKENHKFQKNGVLGKIHHIATAWLIVHLNSPRSFKKEVAPINVSICNTVSLEPSSSLPLP